MSAGAMYRPPWSTPPFGFGDQSMTTLPFGSSAKRPDETPVDVASIHSRGVQAPCSHRDAYLTLPSYHITPGRLLLMATSIVYAPVELLVMAAVLQEDPLSTAPYKVLPPEVVAE